MGGDTAVVPEGIGRVDGNIPGERGGAYTAGEGVRPLLCAQVSLCGLDDGVVADGPYEADSVADGSNEVLGDEGQVSVADHDGEDLAGGSCGHASSGSSGSGSGSGESANGRGNRGRRSNGDTSSGSGTGSRSRCASSGSGSGNSTRSRSSGVGDGSGVTVTTGGETASVSTVRGGGGDGGDGGEESDERSDGKLGEVHFQEMMVRENFFDASSTNFKRE